LALPGAVSLRANPVGGVVATGSATISNGPGVVTINQATNKAVIDWQSFSVGAGELTKFVQPSSASATLNRVLGGQMSIIDGSLTSNGQVFLLNGNGILIGPGGAVSTGGFTASTRDLTDADFASGNLHFTGTGSGGVENLGSIAALGGDVVLIGKTVDNGGSIVAAAGHVGLAAADDVLISQSGLEHVFVRATAGAASAAGQTGVDNSGSIVAAAAELRAANGNIYALATNNSGIVRANGVATENGHIWLVADAGVTQNTGSLVARGTGGQGGAIETSGGQVVAHGAIDAGKGGSWLLDPVDITIDAPAAATIDGTLNGGSNVTEDSTVAGAGTGNITVSAPITWTSTATLTLDAYQNLSIGSAITATSGGTLAVRSANGGTGTIVDTAGVNVSNFLLQGGAWVQDAVTLPGHVLPAFAAASNFAISGGASFQRTSGGTGSVASPYQVVDIYGLQGVGSSTPFLADNWLVTSSFSAAGTSAWNSGLGFAPIGSAATPFTGTFNGGGDAITGLTINTPAATNVGLFGKVGSAGEVLDVILTNASVTGLANVGSLAGTSAGLVETSNVSGTVSGTNSSSSTEVGGMVGENDGTVDSSFSTATVTGYNNVGGLIGSNIGNATTTGIVSADHSSGNVSSFLNATLSGNSIGGLVGLNNGGEILLSYNGGGNVDAADSNNVGGLAGASIGATAVIQQGYTTKSTIQGLLDVGGLVGNNQATITAGKVEDLSGTVHVTGTTNAGGFVGINTGTITDSSVVTTGGILAADGIGPTAASHVGGFVGYNDTATAAITDSFTITTIGEASGTTDATQVGGFAGLNGASATLSGVYTIGNVTGANSVGGLVGENDGILGVQSNTTHAGVPTTVTGTNMVGGLVGLNAASGTIGDQSFSTVNVVGAQYVGGLIGQNLNASSFTSIYATGTVSGTTGDIGGLIGDNEGAGSFTTSHASGNVSASSGADAVGGLIGLNAAATIILSNASGTVSAAGASDVGGLVGVNGGSILSGTASSHSSASGSVTGQTDVGGLVGWNEGTGIVGDALTYVAALADYTAASGNVTGLTDVGGLIGKNSGVARQTSATGGVTGSSTSASFVGGLVGSNEATGSITTSFTSNTVYGNGTSSISLGATDSAIGGLVGGNLGSIILSNSSGAVVGDLSTGGLIGLQNAGGAEVQESYSTGTVTGQVNTGGLVGYEELGIIINNYSTAAATGTVSVGGLVGLEAGSVSDNYSIGPVTGTTDVGGLVGNIALGGTLTQSYATGAVAGGVAGGLAGLNAGTITNSFWDGTSTGQGGTGVGSGVATGATEVSGASAYASATYAGLGSAASVAGANTNAVSLTSGSITWYMFEGGTRPFLAWEAPLNNPTVGGAHVIYTAHQLQLAAMDLGDSYVLGKGIDLSEAQQASGLWNTATGFVPIGDSGTAFTGGFSGASFGISNLFIDTAGSDHVGLFGESSGTLSSVSLSGSVTGRNGVGLLVGELTGGSATGIRASGTVAGNVLVGGIVGGNTTLITDSAVNVAVSGNEAVGGIAGESSGTVRDSYALGNVTGTGVGDTDLGGLVGDNTGTLTISYATGSVTGVGASLNLGGAVGFTDGPISQVYATGHVNGSSVVGGLVGELGGSTITQSYATGAVNSTVDHSGGLVGLQAGATTITSSYASGVVTGADAATTGGIIGEADSTYTHVYWDSAVSAAGVLAVGSASSGAGSVTDLHGDTINSSTATYANLDLGGTPAFTTGFGSSSLIYGSSDSVWRIKTGSEFPFLTQLSTQVSGTAYTDEGHTTVATGSTVTFDSGSNTLSTTTSDAATGAFAFLFAADDGLLNYLPHTNQTLRVSNSAHSADSVAAKLFNGNGVPDLLANVDGADTWGTTVRVVSSGLDNGLMNESGSAFVSGSPGANAYGGTNLLVTENFEIGAIAGSYSIDGDITSEGDFMVDANSSVPASFDHPVTLSDVTPGVQGTPAFTQNAILSSSASNRAIIVDSDGKYVNNVAMGTQPIQTPSGSWIVYSTNPPGAAGVGFTDTTNGINQYHLYGTNPTETPAYLLSPGLNYQIYSFVPELDLYASAATGASTTGVKNIQYGDAQPALGYSYDPTQLLSGDTLGSSGINQVISNQPGENTTYAQFSPQGTYPVNFISSTIPTSLIGYNVVFRPGSLIVGVNTSPTVITFDVSGSQHFGYIGGGPAYSITNVTGTVLGDPNFHPTFTTTVGQYFNVYTSGGALETYMNTISLVPASVSNYSTAPTFTDLGFTIIPASITVSGSGTSIYGEPIATTTLTSSSGPSAGDIYDNSGTGAAVALSTLGFGVGAPGGLTDQSHVGTTALAVSGSGGTTTLGVLSNYNVTVNPGSYTITSRPLVINGSLNETDVYDGTTNRTTFGSTDYTVGATGTGTGIAANGNGDAVTGLMGRAAGNNVGNYLYTAGTLGTNDSVPGDYTLVFSNAGFGYSLTARPITVGVLQDSTKVYGSADPAFNFATGDFGLTAGAFGTGDAFTSTGTLTRTAGTSVNGGVPYAFTALGTVGIVKGATSEIGNYTITFSNLSGFGLTITPAPLTITAKNDTKVYNDTAYSGGNGVTTSGLTNGDTLTSLGAGLTYSGTSQGAVNAGGYVITPSGYTDANYNFTYDPGTLTISKAPLTVTADPQSKIYGGTDPTLTFTGSGTLYGASDIASGYAGLISGVTLSTTTGSAATAGTHTITASGGTASNYVITDVNGTLTVTKAPLTVTADPKSTQYGINPTASLTYTPSGTLYYGDAYSVITGVTLSTTTGPTAVVGTQAITAAGGTASNYVITDAPGTLTITKAPLTVTADNKSTQYGVDPTASLTFTPSGTLYYSDAYSVISGVTLSTTTGPTAVVGTQAITATGGTASNYAITDAPGTLTITKAPLTVTAAPQSKVYGAADPTLTFTPSGTLYYGDAYSVISGVTLATTTGAAATAGTHPITASGGTASNYSITDVGNTLTVSKAPLTVTANDASTQYGIDPTATLSFTPSGTLFYGDAYSVISGVTLSTTTGAAAVVGTQAITATGGTASNYVITDAPGTLTITKAPLTVTADNQGKVYGAADPTLTFTPSGTLYYGDAYSVISGVGLATTTGAAATAGTHTITATGGTASNYAITDANGTLTVSKAALTATADPQTKVYGATDPTLTFTASGSLFYGDAYSVITGVTLATTTGAAATAGTHPITASGGTASNYTVTDVGNTLTVSKAPLTVTANDASTQYGIDPTATLSFTPSGTLFYGDAYSVISGVTLSTTTGAGAVVGTQAITAAGGTASNYHITNVNGTLTINPAQLTVTADPQSKVYGAADPTLTFTPSGTLYYGDAYSVISGVGLSTTTGAAATAGTHPITATGGLASNYTIVDVPGTLTVSKATLTATADDQSKVYGATDPTLTYTGSGTLFYGDAYSVISGVALATTTGAQATAGTHTITATGGTAANYNVVDADGTLTVAKAPLLITPTQTTTQYGITPVVNYVVNGTLYYGDPTNVVTGVVLTTTYGMNPVVGTYSATPSGGVADNYSITDQGITTLIVTPAPLYVAANNQSKVYGGADPTLTFTPTGTLYYGDTYSVISGVGLSTATGAAATAGTHVISASGGTAANYFIVDTNATLTVSKASLTATADNQSKVYGATDPTLTYTPGGTLYYGDTYGVITGVGLSSVTGSSATAGTHVITATGGTASNYNVTDSNGTLTVSKADVTVTADNKSKAYGGTDPALTYTTSGLVYGDSPTVVTGVGLSTVTGAAATTGTHPIVAAGGAASNYNVIDVNGTLTVSQGAITITADPQTKIEGSTFTFLGTEYTVTGLLGSDTVTSVSLTSPAAASGALPGTYPIDLGTGGVIGTGIGNYTITFVSAPFHVLPGSLSGLPISWAVRSEVAALIGTMFESSYGEKQFYELEVPGTLHRVQPTETGGIGSASSIVDVRIGLENIYSLDRFQSFRH
jgi:filamentous hemagglutinin family protein